MLKQTDNNMSATNFYDVADKLRETLLANSHVNTVTYGNISKVATEKTSIYPLSHFVVNSGKIGSNTYTFNITLACMDIIDQTSKSQGDLFLGNSNEMDILNTQLGVITDAINTFKKGSLRREGYKLIGEPITSQFTHRFEDDVAGWDVTFDIEVLQTISLC
jgi:hypothetical protein